MGYFDNFDLKMMLSKCQCLLEAELCGWGNIICARTPTDIYCSKILKKCKLGILEKHFPTETYIQKYLSIWNLFLTFLETFKSNNVFSTNEEYSQLAFWIFLFVTEQPQGTKDVRNKFFLLPYTYKCILFSP